LVEFTRRF